MSTFPIGDDTQWIVTWSACALHSYQFLKKYCKKFLAIMLCTKYLLYTSDLCTCEAVGKGYNSFHVQL